MLEELYKGFLRFPLVRNSVHKSLRRNWEVIDKHKFNLIVRVLNRIERQTFRRFPYAEQLFTDIQIQTQIGCNYNCPFCPANKKGLRLYSGAQEGAKMDLGLFKKIIEELSNLHFNGRLSLYLMNEPLLDDRIVQLTAIARRNCPEAYIWFQTNGSVITKRLIEDLIDTGIDGIHINDYTRGHVVIKRITDMGLPKSYFRHMTLEIRSQTEKFTNRAGNVPKYETPLEPLKLFCVKPFKQMYIAYNGKALLCCQDWQFAEIVGDISQHSLCETWRNWKYQTIRKRLLNFDRGGNALCSKCDFGGLW